MGSAASSMNCKANYSGDLYELNQQESKEQQAPKTLHDLKTEFKELKWAIFEEKQKIKDEAAYVEHGSRARLNNLHDNLESIQIQLESFCHEKMKLADIIRKRHHYELKSEIDEEMKYLKQFLEETKSVPCPFNTEGMNIKARRMKLSSIIFKETMLLTESKWIYMNVCFRIIVKGIPERRVTDHQYIALSLDLSNYTSTKLICKLKTFLFYELSSIEILGINKKNLSMVRSFLQDCNLQSTQRLTLISESAGPLSINNYLSGILSVVHKIQLNEVKNSDESRELHLVNFKISHKSMMKLLSCCRTNYALSFTRCKIFIRNIPDFGHSLDGSKLQELAFHSSSILDQSGSNALDNLLIGLANSDDFRRNLISLEGFCPLSHEYLVGMFCKYGFGC
ncbi:unnamed protein product [Moneuplotes crassus]|uniref:Uncharacterized protein n=1 Tax=Euplotes crassus TaxID=5936 RepID=A0AAD1XG86_EUPCR|nr:unnamed protein product [Moneuplotes crassus]